MQHGKRLAQFQKAEEVMRIMSMQIRLNAAIMEGNADVAERIMSGYLGASSS